MAFHYFTERNWNMWIPGYGNEDFKQSKKLGSTEAHKQVESAIVLLPILLSFNSVECSCNISSKNVRTFMVWFLLFCRDLP